MFQLVIFLLLTNFSISLAVTYYLLLPFCKMTLFFTYLFENLFLQLELPILILCLVYGAEIVSFKLFPSGVLSFSYEVRLDSGLPHWKNLWVLEYVIFFLKLLSSSSTKWGVIKLKYWVVWSMKYKYKAFIMKSSPSRLLVLISLHWCLPCCFLHPYISLYLWHSTLVWDTAQFLCSFITFNHPSFILCLRIWERL